MSASFCGFTLSVLILFNLSVAIPSMIINSYYVFATTDSDDEDDEQQEEEENQQPQEPLEAQPQQPQQPQPQLQPQPDQPSAIQQQQQPLPQQPQQPLAGAQPQQSPLEDFILSGKINSLLPTGNNTWIAEGNWNLVAENGSAKSFMTQMTWTSADGTKAHTHEFQNFRLLDNGTDVLLSPGDTLILDGVMDVGTNDVIDWQGVPTRLYFGNGQTIVVALDDAATNSHFGNQPVFGLVTSLTPCGSPGPSMEVLPRCE
jgi:hypothetical protein